MKLVLILMIAAFSFTGLFAQNIPSYSLEELQEYINNEEEDITYVVNFWATWCAPCVKEMPYFEALNKKYKDENVKVVLVSLDFKNDSRLANFIDKKGIKSEVIYFNEKNPNAWIPKISEKWSGSIPATLVVNKYDGYREFYEQSFHSLKEVEAILP